MGRFSKHDAEAAGWVFVAQRDERTVIEAATQGRTQTLPGYCRAEKYVEQPSGHSTLINETAETMGKLLEQIAAYEAQQERLTEGVQTVPAEIDHTFAPLDTTGLPQRSVAVRVGDEVHYFTEAEWASRDKHDALLTEKGMVNQTGHADAIEAAASRQVSEQEVEARRAELATGAVESKQVFQDLSQQVVDLPGGATGNVLLVHKDDDSMGDVARRREEASIQEENERVAKVAGPEPGIQESSVVYVEGTDVANVKFSETLEEQAQEAGAEADKAENVAKIRQAAGEAEQEAHDDLSEEIEADADDDGEPGEVDETDYREQGEAIQEPGDPDTDVSPRESAGQGLNGPPEHDDQEPSDEDPDIDVTKAARELAEEKDVDLTTIKGTGRNGRITKPDVEAALADE